MKEQRVIRLAMEPSPRQYSNSGIPGEADTVTTCVVAYGSVVWVLDQRDLVTEHRSRIAAAPTSLNAPNFYCSPTPPYPPVAHTIIWG